MLRRIFSLGVISRVIADVLLINFSLFSAFVAQFLWALSVVGGSTVPQVFATTIKDYLENFPLITVVSIIVFSLNGFYTHSRVYRSRFKALVIFQAVSLSFLIVGFSAYLLPSLFDISRRVLVTAWVTSLIVIGCSRLWSVIWKKITLQSNGVRKHDYVDEDAVLVIGGAGYIGSALLPKLLKAGYKVRILDLFLYGKKPIEPYLGDNNLEVIQADFRQIDKVVEAVRGVSSVVHLGAIVGDPACSINERLTVEVNLMATRMIAEVCKGFGVRRFVFASTCSVYGANNQLLNERSQLNPVSLYAKSKIASEKVLQKMADKTFSPTILRFGTVFGFSGRTRLDLVVNLLTAKAFFDKKITVFGGDQWRPFLHVDDAANSIFKVLKMPIHRVDNEIFNVGDKDNNYMLGQLGDLIKQQVPDAELCNMGEDGDRRDYRVDFTKIQKQLGFKTQWTLTAGIQQVLFELAKGTIAHYNHAEFSNFKTLQDIIDEQILVRHIESIKELIDELA